MTFNIHTVHVHLVLLKIHLLIHCKAFLIKYPLIFLLIFLLSKSFHISRPHAILLCIKTFLATKKTNDTYSEMQANSVAEAIPVGLFRTHLPLQSCHLWPRVQPLQINHACHANLCSWCWIQLLCPLLDGGVWYRRGQWKLGENR